MKKKLKDKKYKCVSIKFYYDDGNIFAQPYGFSSPIGKGKTKKSAFEDIKPKIRMAQRRGNLVGCE